MSDTSAISNYCLSHGNPLPCQICTSSATIPVDTPAAPDVEGIVLALRGMTTINGLREAAADLIERLAAEVVELRANGPQVRRGTVGMNDEPWMGTMREAWQDEMAAARAEGRRADELYAREGELAREVEMLREALSKLVGILEIAAVMPDAIGRHLVMRWDAPEIEQARAALAALAARGEE